MESHLNIQKGDLITLSNNKQYLVVSKIIYNSENYLYLVDINDNKNIKFVYEKQEQDKLKVFNVYDNPKNQVSDLQKGLLTTERVKTILENVGGVNADEYFICGPGPMMENIKQTLEGLKIASEKIHIEYFSAVVDAVNKAAARDNDQERRMLYSIKYSNGSS